MAMSLSVLRPVLWSTRLLCRTQRLCALEYQKQHLIERDDSTTSHQSVGSSLTSMSLLCAPRGFCTTSVPKPTEDREKLANDILTKMYDTKSPGALLELVDKCELTAYEAAFAVGVLANRSHAQSNYEGWRKAVGKMSKDPRLVRLGETLIGKARKLSSRNLMRSLMHTYKLQAKNKQAVVDALVPALRSKLRTMETFSLSNLVCNHEMLSDNKQALDLVNEAARVMELRWREMDELNPALLNRLLLVTPRFPSKFKLFISDKVLESLDKFSFSELVQTASILAQLQFRSIAILRAVTYQAIQQRGQWELHSVLRLLESLASVNFYNQPLAYQIAEFIEDQSSEWNPAAVGAVARAYMLLRMPQSGLFDTICNYTLNNLTDFHKLDLNKLLYAFGELGYKPKNEQEFYRKVLAKIEAEFSSYAGFMKVQAASALMLSEQLPESIMKDVLQPKENAAEPTKLDYNDILQMRINTHARLACPDYEGPYLECSFLPDALAQQGSLEQSAAEYLQRALGDRAFLKTDVWTTLGYKLDALVLMDDSNKPVVIDDYQLPDVLADDSEDKKPIPAGFQRIALHIWTPKEMLFESEELTGRCAMQKKHLQMAEYKLVEVNFKKWNEAKTEFQKISLMKFKLAEATLGKDKSKLEQ